MRIQSVPGSMDGQADLTVAQLRRRCLAAGAHLLLAASFAVMPLALLSLLHGSPLAFIVAMIGMTGGSVSLALSNRADHERAAIGQIATLMAIGFAFAMSDPAPVDAGVALMLLGPMLAGLVGQAREIRWSWYGFGAASASAVLAGVLHWSPLFEPTNAMLASAGFTVAAGLVALASHVLGASQRLSRHTQAAALRHIVENVQDAVLRLDARGEPTFASASVEKLLGCPRYQLSSGGLFERVHVLDRPAFMRALAQARESGEQQVLEIRLRQDEPGTGPAAQVPRFIWTEISLSPIRDVEAGRTSELVALLRNVTDRRDRAREMEIARQAAEQASEAKSRFLATVGHELRTPLNAIVGFSEMMASNIGGQLSPTHQEYAGLIGKSGRHLIEIVSMLLDISRLEAGKFEIDPQPMQFAELLEPCLQMVRPLADERKMTVETRISGKLPEIVADERACRQIVINLVSNAIKFSHEGGRIVVDLKRQGNNLVVSVADSGIGMDAAAIGRLGEAFFQAQDGFARRYEGTGLGLSIVKGLIELHGGSLSAMSEAGRGTTMTVLLPINGPATKPRDNAVVTLLHRPADPEPATSWPDARRKAL